MLLETEPENDLEVGTETETFPPMVLDSNSRTIVIGFEVETGTRTLFRERLSITGWPLPPSPHPHSP